MCVISNSACLHVCTKREETSFIYLHGFAEKADDENFGEFPSTN